VTGTGYWLLERAGGSLVRAIELGVRYHLSMAHIKYIPADTADKDLRELYNRYRGQDGEVDNILRIHGPNPPSMEGHYQLYRTLMFGNSPLSRRQREMIAVVVAAAIDCHY